MKAFWVQMINLVLFFDMSMDVAMATTFVRKKWQTLYFRRSGIQKQNGVSLSSMCTLTQKNDAFIERQMSCPFRAYHELVVHLSVRNFISLVISDKHKQQHERCSSFFLFIKQYKAATSTCMLSLYRSVYFPARLLAS